MIASVVEQHTAIRLAVFDVDWTLLTGTSAEALLVKFLRASGLFRVSNMARSVVYFLNTLQNGVIESFLKNKFYLYGLDAQSLFSRMDEFYEEWMKPRLAGTMLDQLSRHREEGDETVLLSGTLNFIIQTLCTKLDIPHGIGSQVEIHDGAFTGRIEGVYPIHHRKIYLLKRHFDGRLIDWPASSAFGDSCWDVPLLHRVGHPMAVHPDVELFREAIRQGWPIEHRSVPFRNPVQRLWVERISQRQN